MGNPGKRRPSDNPTVLRRAVDRSFVNVGHVSNVPMSCKLVRYGTLETCPTNERRYHSAKSRSRPSVAIWGLPNHQDFDLTLNRQLLLRSPVRRDSTFVLSHQLFAFSPSFQFWRDHPSNVLPNRFPHSGINALWVPHAWLAPIASFGSAASEPAATCQEYTQTASRSSSTSVGECRSR